MFRSHSIVFVIALVLTGAAGAAAAYSSPQTGAFALLHGTQRVTAVMEQSQGPGETASIRIAQTAMHESRPIVVYETEMTKQMHVVIVRDDLQTFEHVHPAFDRASGWFTTPVTADLKRQYFVYSDSEPQGYGQQVFRFVLNAATAARRPMPHFTQSPTRSNAGAYAVQLGTTALTHDQPADVDVRIERDGKPASGLAPYLGAPAHVVFIDTATLSYVHVHPSLYGMADMDMQGGSHSMSKVNMPEQAGPHLTLHVPALPAGTYRMWLQFRADGALHDAVFTVAVK